MKKVLIIGAGFLQDFVIVKAKQMGYEVHTVDANPNAVGFQHADHYGVINIVDEKACLEYARDNKIDGVLTAKNRLWCSYCKLMLQEKWDYLA